jgi:hypothetical protein
LGNVPQWQVVHAVLYFLANGGTAWDSLGNAAHKIPTIANTENAIKKPFFITTPPIKLKEIKKLRYIEVINHDIPD